MKVLITTSGTGTRLGNKTKHLNKCLIRVGDKAILSHIIDSYPSDTQFIIALGYKGDIVKQYLDLVHNNSIIKYVNIDKFEGKGSSLLYSMYQCRDELQEPFIFHVSDAIAKFNFKSYDKNFVIGSNTGNRTLYCSYNIINKKIVSFNLKGAISSDFNYIGVAYIKDFKSFWDIANSELQNKKNTSLNDISVFSEMLKENEFEHVEADKWFDTGSVESLSFTQNEIKPKELNEVLDKASEAIYFRDNEIIKFFADPEVNLNRVKRAKILEGVVPEVKGFTNNFYKYEFVEGELYSKKADSTNFLGFLNNYQKTIWVEQENNEDLNALSKKFYYSKTVERVKRFFDNNMIEDKETIINNIRTPKVMDLINSIPDSFYYEGKKSKIHGDFIIDNAIIMEDSFKMIDWRQDFAGSLENGDTYYDLAKLSHNLVVNHEIIDKKLFSIDQNLDGSINLDILRKQKLVECENIFFEWLKMNEYCIKRVMILRGLIWLNMSPLHHKPFDYFLYYHGKLNLFKALNYES